MANIHPQARTTPLIRAEIQASHDTLSTLAARYNISLQTVRKWKQRSDVQDRSHRAHTLCTTLNPLEELVVVEIRRTLFTFRTGSLPASSWGLTFGGTVPRDRR